MTNNESMNDVGIPSQDMGVGTGSEVGKPALSYRRPVLTHLGPIHGLVGGNPGCGGDNGGSGCNLS
jgi:hypothetical protein